MTVILSEKVRSLSVVSTVTVIVDRTWSPGMGVKSISMYGSPGSFLSSARVLLPSARSGSQATAAMRIVSDMVLLAKSGSHGAAAPCGW
ncbi:MAG TPA: hypothetical protein VM533_00980 [Fimbriiglobus sp.]|nr:hypothetical protein [Fimbriiglobus sp.]